MGWGCSKGAPMKRLSAIWLLVVGQAWISSGDMIFAVWVSFRPISFEAMAVS